ncbi:hypothetical protein Nepgr_010402 [Nepenthes gracilis]|uniref:Uncharacterized protein n=1 Tax=Nepenthes gracilis TaxID=150966 RepID=A0AAD3XL16_NEPGR|nr:hypothetical protein Nepgr_010402 [Nepenthes gracilis]
MPPSISLPSALPNHPSLTGVAAEHEEPLGASASGDLARPLDAASVQIPQDATLLMSLLPFCTGAFTAGCTLSSEREPRSLPFERTASECKRKLGACS